MTVDQLIARLQEMPPDAAVEVANEDGYSSREADQVLLHEKGHVVIGDGWEGL